MHSRAEARTHRWVLGAGLRAPVTRPSFPARWLYALPVSWADDSWGALAPHPVVVLRLPASTAGFFFRRDIAILSCLRMAGESCMVEIALRKANSSCLSMMLRQEIHYTTQDTDSRCGQ